MTDILATLDMAQLALIWAVVISAAVLRAFTGFGFGLAAVPVFSLFMAPTQAVVLSSSLTFAISLLTLPGYWGQYPFKPLLPMLGMSLAGTGCGVLVLGQFNPQQFQFWIGLLVILACVVLSFYRPRRRQPGMGVNGLTGLASGLMNGAFAIPGPPVIIYAMATQPDATRSRALLMTFFLFSALLALAFYWSAGFVTAASPALFALAFPAMYVGNKLGFYLFLRLGTRLYRRVALLVLFAVGLAILTKSLV